eukprot:1249962-Alexandrium_andersonii.AAC.1
MAVLHAAWLEHGRDAEALLSWCSSICFVPTDLGVEFAVAEGRSVLGAFFGCAAPPSWPSH